jgi:hypothetical protein
MRIPYVIDNIEYCLADVLNYLLQRQPGQQVDVATAYFSVRGFEQVRETLPGVRRFRLLLVHARLSHRPVRPLWRHRLFLAGNASAWCAISCCYGR